MTRRQRIEDLAAFAVPEQPAVSPDGSRIAYVLRSSDLETDRVVRAIWQVGTRDGEPRRLTRGPSDTAPAWSPDGGRIAFLRAEDGPAQLWLLPADGGEAEQLTTLPLGAGAPMWSPDGARIAFAARVDLRGPGAAEDAPTAVDRLDYRADGVGLFRTRRIHLHVLDPETCECRQVTDGNWDAGVPSWSPDSTRLAFSAAIGPDADLGDSAPVHVLDVTDPAARPVVAGLAGGLGRTVGWTPDGANLLVIGTAGAPGGHNGLLRVPLGGGEPADLAAPLDRNVLAGGPALPGATPQFAADGRTVLFSVRDRGCAHLYAVDVGGGTPRPVLDGAGRFVAGLSVAGDSAATVLHTPTSLGEILVLDLATGAETVRTSHGDPDVEVYVRAEREFTISDGTVVQGWLLRDPATTGPGPLLLDIHGGPHNATNGAADDWHLYQQELVARGWTVLTLNPRRSDGYGAAFFTAGYGAWGEADANDLLEPIDRLVADGIADPARLAVTGYSYGGFMTCYLTSRHDRFAAAVGGGVVTDLTSMAGTSDLGHFLSEYETGGRPWEHPDRYAAQSPLARVDRVRTPTLLLHGEADLRCAVGQAQQWHTALRERGVPTELVLYPGGSHLFPLDGRPSHRIDLNRRVVDWLRQHVTGAGRPRLDAGHWQRRLAVLAERHGVPGAALGILRLGEPDDELISAAYGLLNVDTGVEATADSVFQIGSMTKVWTTTIAMQLADEGLLDLDAPIADVLPELELADDEVTKRVTMRHLLTHTSGIDGDVFTDTGRGDDCLEAYVAGLRDVGQNHPLGLTWSYCNSGFSLAGRVIERLTGGTWDDAVRQRLVRPLGLTRTVTLPEEALLHRAAVGHLSTGRTPVWGLPRAIGPAGLISSTVADVLAFARLHLTGGHGPDGRRLVSEAGVAAMTEKQADLPDRHTLGDSWGLGWVRMGWDGHRLVGHDGNTIGQSAFLRLLGEQGLAVTLLTNGGHTRDLYEELFAEIFAEVAGVAMAAPLAPPVEPAEVDVRPWLGRYERAGGMIEVFEGAGGPTLRATVTGLLAALTPEPIKEYTLVPVEQDLFVVRDPEVRTWSPVTFFALPTGERYVHYGVRAHPKVS
jgi:dipeptidyl aminopeptidase/acylaminoacyl peptidase/CubicO group peptidase (beta-lactamase class C family)